MEDRRPKAMSSEFEFAMPQMAQSKKGKNRGKENSSSNFLASEEDENEEASETDAEKLIF